LSEDWAVIPVRGLADSKTRLSSYLGERKKLLVEALLQDVLSSILRSRVYDKVLVVSPDDSVSALARRDGLSFLGQTGLGLNSAIEQANKLALKENARSLTTILADIPFAEPRDFTELFHLGDGDRRAVLVPSLKGGTNVMTTRPPGVIRPSYGRWSYAKHLRQAQLSGLAAYSVSNPRISFDVDSVKDLIELKRRDPDARTMSAKALREIWQTPSPARLSSIAE